MFSMDPPNCRQALLKSCLLFGGGNPYARHGDYRAWCNTLLPWAAILKCKGKDRFT